MSELCKCLRCGKVLISEEFDLHKCASKINGRIEVIKVDFWITGKHPKTDEDLISATAMDGTTYWLVKRGKSTTDKMPYKPTNLNNQNKQPDNEQKINLSLVKYLNALFDYGKFVR